MQKESSLFRSLGYTNSLFFAKSGQLVSDNAKPVARNASLGACVLPGRKSEQNSLRNILSSFWVRTNHERRDVAVAVARLRVRASLGTHLQVTFTCLHQL